jgi:hypothetical protein
MLQSLRENFYTSFSQIVGGISGWCSNSLFRACVDDQSGLIAKGGSSHFEFILRDKKFGKFGAHKNTDMLLLDEIEKEIQLCPNLQTSRKMELPL